MIVEKCALYIVQQMQSLQEEIKSKEFFRGLKSITYDQWRN